MRSILKIVALFIAATLAENFALSAQGFDWQYSPRLPFETPRLFFGVSGEGSYIEHGGDFGFIEDQVHCCNFKRGFGAGFRLALATEYWYKPQLAFSVKLGYSNYPGDFRMQNSKPINPEVGEDYIAVYENRYESQFSYATLELSAKRRLFSSHFFGYSSLETGVLIYSSERQTERVVSPDFETFEDGSISRTITQGAIPGVRSFYGAVRLGAGYDFNLGKGVYGAISTNVALPLNSLSSMGTWNRRAYSIGVTIMRGFIFEF